MTCLHDGTSRPYPPDACQICGGELHNAGPFAYSFIMMECKKCGCEHITIDPRCEPLPEEE